MNKTTTEFEIKVSDGKIILPKNLPDGVYKRVVQIETPATERTVASQRNGEFVRIPASELSLNDKWFKEHQPKTGREKQFKELVRTAIKKGLKDFWRPKYDPSFLDEEKTGICYIPGKKPAVGKSYNWWAKTARNFKPECKSRLGTESEYVAFLAVLIKKLVASGWKVQDAWHAVCNDSKELGHYWKSKNAKHDFEDTGCREICGFYDLANTCKILAEDKEAGGFWFAGGDCCSLSDYDPLVDLYHYYCRNDDRNGSTGWLVLESSTDH